MKKGRSKRTSRRNRDYEWDEEQGKQVLKKHVQEERRRKAAQRRADEKAQNQNETSNQEAHDDDKQQSTQPETEEPHFDREHAPEYKEKETFQPWVKPARRRPSPCTCSEEEQSKVNQRLYKALMARPVTAFNKATGAWDIVVINRGFQRKHVRHLGHFEKFLEEENIRFKKL